MSSNSWQEAFESALNRLTARGGADGPRVALVGVGQELRGDDAVGVVVARRLRTLLADRPQLLILDGGPAPESQTGRLRGFGPSLIIFVDAAQLGDPPGTVRWLPWEATVGMGNSTHGLPIEMVARFLTATLGCEVVLIGIQPASMNLDAPLTPTAHSAAELVTARLLTALAKLGCQNEVAQHD